MAQYEDFQQIFERYKVTLKEEPKEDYDAPIDTTRIIMKDTATGVEKEYVILYSIYELTNNLDLFLDVLNRAVKLFNEEN